MTKQTTEVKFLSSFSSIYYVSFSNLTTNILINGYPGSVSLGTSWNEVGERVPLYAWPESSMAGMCAAMATKTPKKLLAMAKSNAKFAPEISGEKAAELLQKINHTKLHSPPLLTHKLHF